MRVRRNSTRHSPERGVYAAAAWNPTEALDFSERRDLPQRTQEDAKRTGCCTGGRGTISSCQSLLASGLFCVFLRSLWPFHFGVLDLPVVAVSCGRFCGVNAALRGRRRAGERGITLVDCLVYISLLGVFLYLTSVAVFQADMGSKQVRRNATEIARAMRAGEAWRDDLRGATGAVESVRGAAGEGVRIPRAQGAVVWAFREAGVWRTRDGATWELLLPGVKASEMRADPQALAGVWRWEVELQTTRTNASVRPLFSFSAVAGPGGTK